jgi:hypothetical protein
VRCLYWLGLAPVGADTVHFRSSQHNLGFGRCVAGRLVKITASQGVWTVGR